MNFWRKNILLLASSLLAGIGLLTSLAYAEKSGAPSKEVVMNSPVKRNAFVEIGESPESWVNRYGKQVEINAKNHGLKFYSLDWPTKNPGQLTVRNGPSEFLLDATLGAMGTFDDEYPAEGFSKILITAGISTEERISHDEARQKIFALLRKIQNAGWRHWIYPGDPRLSGEDSFRYQIAEDDTFYSLDPNYLPPMSVWMKLSDRSQWKFYSNGVQMSVRFSRDQDRMKPDSPGSYIIWLELQSRNELERGEFQEGERAKWKILYPEIRKKRLSERANQEKKLQALGYKIDIKYKNPDE
jgi:hypothetical protein